MTRTELQNTYSKESNSEVTNSIGGFSIEYVRWLEDKIITQWSIRYCIECSSNLVINTDGRYFCPNVRCKTCFQ